MGNKEKTNWADAVNDAATGYSVVVLSVICFLIALVVVVAGIRIIAGTGTATSTGGATATVSVSSGSTGRSA